MTHKLVKWGAFLGELFILLMLYSATLLAPIPFGFLRVTNILLFASASCALAYFASSRQEGYVKIKRLSFKQVVSKLPFVVWIAVVAVIMLQLAGGLLMAYLANRR
jgi:hypothetical protein